MKRFGRGLSAVFVVTALLCASGAGAAEPSPAWQSVRLSAEAAETIRLARNSGQSTLTVMLLVEPAKTAAVNARVQQAGAVLRFIHEPIGYLRVVVPIAQVEGLGSIPGVQVIEPLSTSALLEERRRKAKEAYKRKQAHMPDPRSVEIDPQSGPYFATREIGVDRLRRIKSAYDGRGTVIGIIDDGIDFSHPVFRAARTLEGRPVDKILAVEPAVDIAEGVDPWWVDMQTKVSARAGKIEHSGAVYTAPSDGNYRLGFFDAAEIDALIGAEVAARCAVILDPKQGKVWVDTNRNNSFQDEDALGAYRDGRPIGWFGGKDAAVNRRVAFLVNVAKDGKSVYLAFATGSHGTMAASSAVANRESGGLFDGVAPNAQLVVVTHDSVHYGGQRASHAWLEGIIRLAADPRVDLVSISAGILGSMAGPVMQRLSLVYRKPIVYAGLFDAKAPVFAVAMYMSADIMRRNLGIEGARKDFIIGKRYTNPDGRLVPVVLMPTHLMAAASMVSSSVSSMQEPSWDRGIELPWGYRIGGGSSQSTPVFAGLLAQVISAARQENIPVDLVRLSAAVNTGSRWVSGEPGANKSAPLPQADQVFAALRRMADAPPAEIEVDAPLKKIGVPQARGLGVVDEDTKPGRLSSYVVQLRHKHATKKPLTYALRWRGNDGTFSSVERITLTGTQSTAITITARPASRGQRTAVLQLIDPRSEVAVGEVPVTVMTPLRASSKPLSEKVIVEGLSQWPLPLLSAGKGAMEVVFSSPDPQTRYWVFARGQVVVVVGSDQMSQPSGELAREDFSIHWGPIVDPQSRQTSYRVRMESGSPLLWEVSVRRREMPVLDVPPQVLKPDQVAAVPVSVTAVMR